MWVLFIELMMSYPEFDEEESILRALFKEVFQSAIFLGKLVGYVKNIDRLEKGFLTLSVLNILTL